MFSGVRKTSSRDSMISYTIIHQPINTNQTQEETEHKEKADNENIQVSDRHGILVCFLLL
jgi:predicted AAA+ superfamily ATPase